MAGTFSKRRGGSHEPGALCQAVTRVEEEKVSRRLRKDEEDQ